MSTPVTQSLSDKPNECDISTLHLGLEILRVWDMIKY